MLTTEDAPAEDAPAEATMDAVFQALAHPSRRRILDLLRADPGSCVGDVCEQFQMSRIGVMKHLRILEEASLVISRTEGRKRLLYVNAMPIQTIYDRWISGWSALWAHEIAALKHRVETVDAQPTDEVTIDG